MKKFKSDKFILILFCMYIYPIIFQKISIISYVLIYGVPVIYLLLNIKLLVKLFHHISKNQFICMILVVIMFVLSYLLPLHHGTGDFTYVRTVTFILRKLLIYVFLMMVLWKKYKEKTSVEHFMYYFSLATVLYVISTLVLTMLPSLKSFWLSMATSEFEMNLFESYGYAMRVGWQGYSGFRCTFRCTLTVAFLMYFLLTKDMTISIKKEKISILLLFAFMGNAFYGRSGLVVSLLTVILAMILAGKIGLKRIVQLTLIAICGFFILSFLGKTNSVLQDWYIWMSTPFKNFFTTGSFNNYSVDHLVNDMLFIPSNKTLVFGDGYYTNSTTNSYYMETDSGLMRQLLFWGVIGTSVSYGCVLILFSSFKDKYKMLSIILLLGFIIFEIKGEVYYEYIPLLVVFIQMILLEKRKIYQKTT